MRLDRGVQSVGALLLGLVLLAPAGFAHDGKDRRDRDEAGRGRAAGEYGADRGYQDGLRHGLNDRNRRAGYNYRSDEWRHADRGSERNMGPRGQYIQGYRDGYIRGYDEAFYGRNRGRGGWGRDRDDDDWGRSRRPARNGYPGNGGYESRYLVQLAQQNGYQDGVYYGQMDRRNGHSNRPTQVNGYRDADRGYDSALGSKSHFQRI